MTLKDALKLMHEAKAMGAVRVQLDGFAVEFAPARAEAATPSRPKPPSKTAPAYSEAELEMANRMRHLLQGNRTP